MQIFIHPYAYYSSDALLLHNTFSVKLMEAYIDIKFWRQITAIVNTTNYYITKYFDKYDCKHVLYVLDSQSYTVFHPA